MSNTPTNYVGVTGFTTREQVAAVLPALRHNYRLMVGVLVSQKTLAGLPNKYPLRYPKVADVADVFVDDPRCLNLVHYCSSTPPDVDTLQKLADVAGPRCHGYQFNGAWPEPDALATVLGQKGLRLVLQLQPGVFVGDLFPYYREGLVTDVLIDGSGGRGEAIPLDGATHTRVNVLRGTTAWGVGIAGGLCEAEILRLLVFLCAHPNLSLDAEGKLRDGDAGGALNLERARAWVMGACEALHHARAGA